MKIRPDTTGLATDGDVAIDVPEHFAAYSPDQRRAWATDSIRAIAMDLLGDMAMALHGRPPTVAERRDFRARIAPGLADACWPVPVAGGLDVCAGAAALFVGAAHRPGRLPSTGTAPIEREDLL